MISGGYDDTADKTLSYCFELNITTQDFNRKASLNHARRGHGTMLMNTSYDDKMLDTRLYVFGGYGGLLKSAEVYKIDKDAWNALPDMPVAGGHNSCVDVQDGILISSWDFSLIGYFPANMEYIQY